MYGIAGHTFFMTTRKHGERKKIIKSLVHHRTCRTCVWWKRNRPGAVVREHACVLNHKGSARAIEGAAGVTGIKDLQNAGTPIEIIEGDGDYTTIARVRNELGISLKKKFDRNHIVKNFYKVTLCIIKRKASKTKQICNHAYSKMSEIRFCKKSGKSRINGRKT